MQDSNSLVLAVESLALDSKILSTKAIMESVVCWFLESIFTIGSFSISCFIQQNYLECFFIALRAFLVLSIFNIVNQKVFLLANQVYF